MLLFKLNNYSEISKPLLIFLVFLGIAIFVAFSISTDRLYLIIALSMVGILFVHPIYILFLIIILNPLSDWIVVNFPSLFSKVLIDILIGMFLLATIARKIVARKPWIAAPFYKWVCALLIFYIISAIFHSAKVEDFLFMNWVHFRFVYLAMAIAQLNLDSRKYHGFMKILISMYFLLLGIGLFQAVGGEWAKDLFYRESQKISLSYGLFQYNSYDTALHFNEAGITYIYSTFFSPSHFGGFLILMICVFLGMRKARSYFYADKDWNVPDTDQRSFISNLIKNKYYYLIAIITIIEIVLTYSRSTYLGMFAVISFLIFISGSSLRKIVVYEVALIIGIVFIVNMDSLINYVGGVTNPEVGAFNPIARGLNIFSSYILQDTPRKIAYWNILPQIMTEMPLFGLGVTSVLNKEKYFFSSVQFNNALEYVYGDAGYVRMLVEFGVLGTLIYCLLFYKIFRYARKRYILANIYEDKVLCFAAMIGIISLIPISVGTMLVLSKSYGLYLWMFIGFSQRWRLNCSMGSVSYV